MPLCHTNQYPCLTRFLASSSTLLLSYPGFWGTPFCILFWTLKLPIMMKLLVLAMQAPPCYCVRSNLLFWGREGDRFSHISQGSISGCRVWFRRDAWLCLGSPTPRARSLLHWRRLVSWCLDLIRLQLQNCRQGRFGWGGWWRRWLRF